MYEKLEVLSDALCIVGEGCTWLPREKKIAHVDIRGRSIRKFDPQSGKIQAAFFPQMVAFLVEEADGGLLAGAVDGIYRVDMDGKFEKVNKPFTMEGDRFNDGKIGPDGRLYGGTICAQGQGAAFYRMEEDGTITRLLDGIGNSNGLDWDEKLGILYYNDTRTLKTDAFDFDPDSGRIFNRRTVVTYTEGGVPDGMCIDAEGNLWTAMWGGSRVVCFNPRERKIVQEIPLPAAQPSCCCFWGDNLENLVITSAATGRPLGTEPLSGALFTVKPGVCGVPKHTIAMKK